MTQTNTLKNQNLGFQNPINEIKLSKNHANRLISTGFRYQQKLRIFLLIMLIILSTAYRTYADTLQIDVDETALIEAIANASANNPIEIQFASTGTITLTSGEIKIPENHNITITAANEKVTISGNNTSRIFSIATDGELIINNLILADGEADNDGGYGGAVVVDGNFTAINCMFNENNATSRGGAAFVPTSGNFVAVNCTFNKNASSYGGAVYTNGSFTAVNCTFNENNATSRGGAVAIYFFGTAHLYHSTIYNNAAIISHGGIYGSIYSYNCIYIGNKVDGAVTTAGQTQTILAGRNLINNATNTNAAVFGNNTFTDGYIVPREFAKSATRLTTSIATPSRVSADTIISWLAKDKAGVERPITGYVTYGAVECKEGGIEEAIKLGFVNISPNPTSADFVVSFDVLKASNVKIVLSDLLGQEVAQVYDGFADAEVFTRTIRTENLMRGVYFLQILLDGNIIVKKVIVE